MSQPSDRTEQHLREHAERNLGALVISIEFTLISVMVGVILFPLMDNAAILLRDLRWELWPYILSGLLFTLLLWTQVISHSLSFVGWPIDIGHNLLYIVFALVLGVQMHFIMDPRGWFAVSFISTLVAWLLVYYDARVIEERMTGVSGAALALFTVALERQRNLGRQFVIAFADALLNLGAVLLWSPFMIDRPGHLILIALQLLLVLGLTVRTIQVFKSWTEPVVRKAMQELALEGED
ncbi:MAG: hypothetical protein WCF84_25135 [Anaerolineae bacterium]